MAKTTFSQMRNKREILLQEYIHDKFDYLYDTSDSITYVAV